MRVVRECACVRAYVVVHAIEIRVRSKDMRLVGPDLGPLFSTARSIAYRVHLASLHIINLADLLSYVSRSRYISISLLHVHVRYESLYAVASRAAGGGRRTPCTPQSRGIRHMHPQIHICVFRTKRTLIITNAQLQF